MLLLTYKSKMAESRDINVTNLNVTNLFVENENRGNGNSTQSGDNNQQPNNEGNNGEPESLQESLEFLFYFSEGIDKLKGAIMGMAAPFQQSVGLVEQFNQQMLQAQIAYTIATEQTDAFGNAISNFGNRMGATKDQFKQLAVDIEKSTQNIVGLTSSRLNNVMNETIQESASILPQFTPKVGTDPLEVVKKLTENLSATFSLLGSPEFQDPQEVRALLMGNVNDPNAFVAGKLNISTAEAQEAQAQGRYVDLLLERTQAYREASTLAAGSLTNVSSNFQELQEQISRGFGEPLMQELTKSAGKLFDTLNSTKGNSKTDVTLSANKAIVALEKDKERLTSKRELAVTDTEREEIDTELSSVEENIKQTEINANSKLASLGIGQQVELFQGSTADKEKQISEYENNNPQEDTPVQRLIELAGDLGESFTNIVSSLAGFGASIANLFKSLGGLGALKGLFEGLRTVIDGASAAINFVSGVIKRFGDFFAPLEPILSPIFAVLGTGVGALFTLMASFIALNTTTGLVIASFREMSAKMRGFYDRFAMFRNNGGNPINNSTREVVTMGASLDNSGRGGQSRGGNAPLLLAPARGTDVGQRVTQGARDTWSRASSGITMIGNRLNSIDFMGVAMKITFLAGAMVGFYKELPNAIEKLKKASSDTSSDTMSRIYNGLASTLGKVEDFWFKSGVLGVDRDENSSRSESIRDSSKTVTDGIFRRIDMLYNDPKLTVRNKYEKAILEGGETAEVAKRQADSLVKEYRLSMASVSNAGKTEEEIMQLTDPNLTDQDKKEIFVRSRGLADSEEQKKLEVDRAKTLADQIRNMTGVNVEGDIQAKGGRLKGDFANDKITAMESGLDIFTSPERALDVGADTDNKFNSFMDSTNSVLDQDVLGLTQLESVSDRLLEVFKNDALSSDLRMKAVEAYNKAIQKELEIVTKLAEASEAFSNSRFEAGEISKEQNDYDKALAGKMKADGELEKGLKEQTLQREKNQEQKSIDQQEIAKLQQLTTQAPKKFNEINDSIKEQEKLLESVSTYRGIGNNGNINLGQISDVSSGLSSLDKNLVASTVDMGKVDSFKRLADESRDWKLKGQPLNDSVERIGRITGTSSRPESMIKLRSMLSDNQSVQEFVKTNIDSSNPLNSDVAKEYDQFLKGDVNMLSQKTTEHLFRSIVGGLFEVDLSDVTKDEVKASDADITANNKRDELTAESDQLLKDISIDIVTPEQQALVDDIANKLNNVEVGSDSFKELKDQEIELALSETNLEGIRNKIKDLQTNDPKSEEIPVLQAQEKALLDRRELVKNRDNAKTNLAEIIPELEGLNKKLMTGTLTGDEEKRRESLDNTRRDNERTIEQADEVLYNDTDTKVRTKQEESAKAEKEREEVVKSQIMMLTQEAITQSKLLKLAEARLKRAQEIAEAESAVLEASKALAEVQLKAAKSFNPELYQDDVAKANLTSSIKEEEQAMLDADISKDMVGVRKSIETSEAINTLKSNEDNLKDEDIKTELERRFKTKFTTAKDATKFLDESSIRSTGVEDLLSKGKTDDKNLNALKSVLGEKFDFQDKDLLADVASSAIIGSDKGVKLATIGNEISNSDSTTLTEKQKQQLEELGVAQDKLNSKASAERAIRGEIAKITGSNEVTLALNEQTAAEEKALLATKKRIDASKALLDAIANVAIEEQKRLTRESGVSDVAKNMGIGVAGEDILSSEDLNLNDSIRQYQDAMVELREFKNSRTKEQIEKIEGLSPEEVNELMSGGSVEGFSADEAEKFRNALESAKKAMDAIEQKANSVFEKATNKVGLLADLGSIGVGPMNGLSKAQRDLSVSQAGFISAMNKVRVNGVVNRDASLTDPIGLGEGRGFDPLSTERLELIRDAAKKAQEYILSFAESIKDGIRQNIDEINSLVSGLESVNSALSIGDRGISALSSQANAIMGDLEPEELEGKSIYDADEFQRRDWDNRSEEESKITSLKEMQAQFEKEQAALAAKRQETEAKITAMKLKASEMELKAERLDILADPNLSKEQKTMKLASNSMKQDAVRTERAMFEEIIPQLSMASQVADARAKGQTNRATAEELMSMNLQSVADARARAEGMDQLVDQKRTSVDGIAIETDMMQQSGEASLSSIMDSVSNQFGEFLSQDQLNQLSTDSSNDLNSNVSKILSEVTKIANKGQPTNIAKTTPSPASSSTKQQQQVSEIAESKRQWESNMSKQILNGTFDPNTSKGWARALPEGVSNADIQKVLNMKGTPNEIQPISSTNKSKEDRVQFTNKLSNLDPSRYDKWLGGNSILSNVTRDPVIPLPAQLRNTLPTVPTIEDTFRRRTRPSSELFDTGFGKPSSKSGSSVITIEERSSDILRSIDKNVQDIKSSQRNGDQTYTVNIPTPDGSNDKPADNNSNNSTEQATNLYSSSTIENTNNVFNNVSNSVENSASNVQNTLNQSNSNESNTQSVENVSNNTNQLTENISNLSNQLIENVSNLVNNQSVESVSNVFSQLTENISNLTSQLTENVSNLTNNQSVENISNLSNQLVENVSNLTSQLTENVSNLTNNQSVENVSNLVSQLTENVSNLTNNQSVENINSILSQLTENYSTMTNSQSVENISNLTNQLVETVSNLTNNQSVENVSNLSNQLVENVSNLTNQLTENVSNSQSTLNTSNTNNQTENINNLTSQLTENISNLINNQSVENVSNLVSQLTENVSNLTNNQSVENVTNLTNQLTESVSNLVSQITENISNINNSESVLNNSQSTEVSNLTNQSVENVSNLTNNQSVENVSNLISQLTENINNLTNNQSVENISNLSNQLVENVNNLSSQLTENVSNLTNNQSVENVSNLTNQLVETVSNLTNNQSVENVSNQFSQLTENINNLSSQLTENVSNLTNQNTQNNVSNVTDNINSITSQIVENVSNLSSNQNVENISNIANQLTESVNNLSNTNISESYSTNSSLTNQITNNSREEKREERTTINNNSSTNILERGNSGSNSNPITQNISTSGMESLLSSILGALQSIGSIVSGLSQQPSVQQSTGIIPKIEVSVNTGGGLNPPIPQTPVFRNTGLMVDESLKLVERSQLMRK